MAEDDGVTGRGGRDKVELGNDNKIQFDLPAGMDSQWPFCDKGEGKRGGGRAGEDGGVRGVEQ